MRRYPVPYHLNSFPPDSIDLSKIIPYVGPANADLARFDGLLSAIPNSHVLLSPLRTQEAVLSSKIEGTHVTMGEVLELEAGETPSGFTQSKHDDAEEVLNYRRAMLGCMTQLEKRPISQHMIREAHAELMKGVRGQSKSPGGYRTQQNWIGPKNCSIDEAGFIPIAPELLIQGMDTWEQFVNSPPTIDALVHVALLHLEFEALHPFMDGNGRLGRMIIPLYLYQRRILSSPDFYMSKYLEANREEYQERLRAVSRDGDWTEWCIFFLEGISIQAKENEDKARSILDLYESFKQKVIDLTHSQHAIRAVDFIFQTPIFNTPMFIQYSGIPKPTASRIISVLREKGHLMEIREGKGRRAGIYGFHPLIAITST